MGDEWHHVNPYQDIMNTKSFNGFLEFKGLNSTLRKGFIGKLDISVNRILLRIRNMDKFQDGNYSVFEGACGVALLQLLWYKRTQKMDYLRKGINLVEKSLSLLKNEEISFLLGDSGPLALGAVLYALSGDQVMPHILIKRLIDLPETIKTKPTNFQVVYGYSGYLYALLFVKKELGGLMPDEPIRKTIELILEEGMKNSKRVLSPAPLYYEWLESKFLGAAHGVGGILYILLCGNNYLTDYERHSLIRPTLDWITECFRFPSMNFKATFDPREIDSLVQWSHGSSGMVFLYILASEVYNSQYYTTIATNCGQVIWSRGIVRKGYSLSNGVSGNGYALLCLYKKTKLPEYLFKLACFADWCTTHPNHAERKPTYEYSLYEGATGVAYFLYDIKDPLNGGLPAYVL